MILLRLPFIVLQLAFGCLWGKCRPRVSEMRKRRNGATCSFCVGCGKSMVLDFEGWRAEK